MNSIKHFLDKRGLFLELLKKQRKDWRKLWVEKFWNWNQKN